MLKKLINFFKEDDNTKFDLEKCYYEVEQRMKGILKDKGYGEFFGGTLYLSFNPEKYQQEYVFVNGHDNKLTVKHNGSENFYESTEAINLLMKEIYLKHKTEKHSFYSYWQSYVCDAKRSAMESTRRSNWFSKQL